MLNVFALRDNQQGTLEGKHGLISTRHALTTLNRLSLCLRINTGNSFLYLFSADATFSQISTVRLL